MASKDLKMWWFTQRVLGQERLVVVLDYLVSGADKRLSGVAGVPNLKNCLVGEEIPAWARNHGPGVLVSALPILLNERDKATLNRYSVSVAAHPPAVVPAVADEGLHRFFVHAAQDLNQATEALAGVLNAALLQELNYSYMSVTLIPATAARKAG